MWTKTSLWFPLISRNIVSWIQNVWKITWPSLPTETSFAFAASHSDHFGHNSIFLLFSFFFMLYPSCLSVLCIVDQLLDCLSSYMFWPIRLVVIIALYSPSVCVTLKCICSMKWPLIFHTNHIPVSENYHVPCSMLDSTFQDQSSLPLNFLK